MKGKRRKRLLLCLLVCSLILVQATVSGTEITPYAVASGGNSQRPCRADKLLADSLDPAGNTLTVGIGEILRLAYEEGTGIYGIVTGSGESQRYTVASGVTLNCNVNGALVIDNVDMDLGRVTMTGGNTKLYVYGGHVRISELNQTGSGCTTAVHDGGQLEITEQLTLHTGTIDLPENTALSTKNLTLSGAAVGSVRATGDVSGSGSISTLRMDGDGQTISGSPTVEDLTLAGSETRVTGSVTAGTLTLNGGVLDLSQGHASVTGTLAASGAYIDGGRNLRLTGTLYGGTIRGSLTTAAGATLSGAAVTETVYDEGGTAYAGTVSIDHLRLSGASALADGCDMTVRGTLNMTSSSASLSGGAKLTVNGDLIASDSNALIDCPLWLSGQTKQELSGGFTLGEFHWNGNGDLYLANTVTVKRLLDIQGTRELTGTPLYLESGCVLQGGYYNGSLVVTDWAFTGSNCIGGDLTVRSGGTINGNGGNLTVMGTLNAEGVITLRHCAVTAGGVNSPSSLNLDSGATLRCTGTATLSGTVASPAPLLIDGDLKAQGLTVPEVVLKGDLIVSDTTSFQKLTLNDRLRQDITGSDFTVGDLVIENTSYPGVFLNQTITVTGTYTNSRTLVTGGKIYVVNDHRYDESDHTYYGDQNWSQDMTITDSDVTINGMLYLNGGKVTLRNASLTVKGNIVQSGGGLDIGEGSSVTVLGQVRLTNAPVTLSGTLSMRSDLVLSSSPISGGGTLDLGGDLAPGGTKIEVGTLIFGGLVRQYIDGSGVRAGNVTLRNPSRGGVVLQSDLTYTGTLDTGTTALTGAEHCKKEAA